MPEYLVQNSCYEPGIQAPPPSQDILHFLHKGFSYPSGGICTSSEINDVFVVMADISVTETDFD